jgi:hypothetical protein
MNDEISYNFAKYLANSDFGALGTDIFAGEIPSEADGIWIIRSSGTLNNYVPIETVLLDIYCKNVMSSEAIYTLERVKKLIHRMHSTSINSSEFYSMLVISDIEDVSRDLEYSKIYKLTVSVMHRDLRLIS